MPAALSSLGSSKASEAVHAKIDAELHMVVLKLFSEMIAERMMLLEVLAAWFNSDSRSVGRACLAVMNAIASTVKPSPSIHVGRVQHARPFDCRFLHDIGKSGPFDASRVSQRAVVKLYAVENVPDPVRTIADTVRVNFSFGEAESILQHLGSCGIRPTDTMREFWDRHG